jgi:hypothetical protein
MELWVQYSCNYFDIFHQEADGEFLPPSPFQPERDRSHKRVSSADRESGEEKEAAAQKGECDYYNFKLYLSQVLLPD